jgi:branched-chain amino acid transport system substrate-binding protein
MNKKSSMTRLVVFLGVTIILSLLFSSCAPAVTPTAAPTQAQQSTSPTQAPAANTTPITLNFVGPLTGPDGVDGQGAAKAVELAVNLTNQNGGVCGGRQLKYVANDTKADPKEGATIASLICGDQNAFGAVADYNSSVALAEAPVFNECKVSQVNYYAAAPDIPKKGGAYTFRVYPPGQNMSIYLADWIVNKQGLKNIVVLYENTDYGKGLYDPFVAEIEKTDAKILDAEAVLKDQTDLSAVVSKFQSLNPDVVVGFIQYQVGAYFETQSKNIGFNVPLYGSDGLFAPEIIKLAGTAVEGIRTVAAYSVKSTDPVVADFVSKYNAAYGVDPNNPAGYAYDASMAIINGLNGTSCSGREALQQWLAANMKNVKGVTGTITLDDVGERVFAPGMYTPIEIKDGQWVEVTQ